MKFGHVARHTVPDVASGTSSSGSVNVLFQRHAAFATELPVTSITQQT
jgi:hypothetical protein